jgi:flagellar motor switch protein FliM
MIEAVAEAVGKGNQLFPVPGEEGQERQEEQEGAGPAEEVQVSVHLPATRIDRRDVEELQVGEIITTDIGSDAPLRMQLDGIPRYQSQAGIVDGQLAVRITGFLDSDDLADETANEDETMPADETAG